MKILVSCFVVTAVLLVLPSDGDADCCYTVPQPRGKFCLDCTLGTPYCGSRSCNVFGCNCDGGCRRRGGFCFRVRQDYGRRRNSLARIDNAQDDVIRGAERGRKRNSPTRIDNAHHDVIRDARDVIRAADVDGDGRLSLEEARAHLTGRGIHKERVNRSLKELDLDKDTFLTTAEIDDYFE